MTAKKLQLKTIHSRLGLEPSQEAYQNSISKLGNLVTITESNIAGSYVTVSIDQVRGYLLGDAQAEVFSSVGEQVAQSQDYFAVQDNQALLAAAQKEGIQRAAFHAAAVEISFHANKNRPAAELALAVGMGEMYEQLQIVGNGAQVDFNLLKGLVQSPRQALPPAPAQRVLAPAVN